ncbi:unnamed protein product, partial [Urochloa humidicola]
GDHRRLGLFAAFPSEDAPPRATATGLPVPLLPLYPRPPPLPRVLGHAAGAHRRRAPQKSARSRPATRCYCRGSQPACRARRVRRRHGRALLLVVLALLIPLDILFLFVVVLLLLIVLLLVLVQSLVLRLLIVFLLFMVESILILLLLFHLMVDALRFDFLLDGAEGGGDARIRRHNAASPGGYGRPARRGFAVLGLPSFGVRQRSCPVPRRAALHQAEDDRRQTPGCVVGFGKIIPKGSERDC